MRIDANARTIRQLLSNTKYKLDYYQREYSWQTKHVTELLDDLSKKFLESFTEGDTLANVPKYNHYFLGSIIISHSPEDGQRYIVDGQQRVTTLTLILIWLYRSLAEGSLKNQVEQLIYSLSGGTEGFNLEVSEWCVIMTLLYEGKPYEENGDSESVRNIALRYSDVEDYFEIQEPALSSFAYWLLDNVYLVEIAAYDSRDAYAIFETVNDRGLSLTPTDMLRGYLLSNIEDVDRRNSASEIWRKQVQSLQDIDKEEDTDAIKAWLRSQYAENTHDFERIGSEFHRWVSDHEKKLGLTPPDGYTNFIARDFAFYTNWYYRLRSAGKSLTPGFECVYYNAQNNFTLQYPVLLSPLQVDDTEEEILSKIQIGAMYLDILIHRRIWNFQEIAQRSMVDQMFLVMQDIRGTSSSEMREKLYILLQAQTKPFSENSVFGLHGGNRRKIFLILARMTDYVEVQSGQSSRYLEYMRTGRNRYEIEHIWAARPKVLPEEFHHESEFEVYRNRIGGLLLLPKSDNASSGDDPYSKKLKVYAGQNLLAQSLHENAYLNKPGFRKFREASGLDFKSHNEFNKKDLDERQELYLQLAEQIWNPKRLKTDYGTESGNTGEQDLPSGCEDKHHSEDSVLVEDGDNKSLEKWTENRIKEIVPRERREHYETKHRGRVNEFYRRAAELQNFVEVREWKLPLKFLKYYCSFYIGNKRVFGVRIHYSPPKFAVFLSEKEFEGLKDYCEPEDYCKSRRYAFYPAGTTIEQLSPILEYAYKKLQGY